MEQVQCFIGGVFNLKCHEDYLRETKGYSLWHELETTCQVEILANSNCNGSNISITDTDVICNHHKKEFSYPSTKNKHKTAPCVNPLGIHATNVHTEKLKVLLYLKHLQGNPFSILPGQRVCRSCVVKCAAKIESDIENAACETKDPDWQMENVKFSKINEVCRALGLPEFTAFKLNKVKAAKKAVNTMKEIVASLVNAFMNDGINISDVVSEQFIQKAKDCDALFEELKQKFEKSTYKEQIQLLTLIPESSTVWTISYTSTYFNCPKYAVSKARKLKKQCGILAVPLPYKPRVFLSAETVAAVMEFYKRENNVWSSPNVRDTKKVKLESGTEYRRVVYLLHPLKELYEVFRNETKERPNLKIGFSSFANLRPVECAIYGKKALENVCVCMNHGNIELIINALGQDREFRNQLVRALVCNPDRVECMLQLCEVCTKTKKESHHNAFCALVKDKLPIEEHNSEIKYSIWKSEKVTINTHNKKRKSEKQNKRSRVGLVEIVQPVCEFIESFYSMFLKFLPHEKLTKMQSNAFQEHKNTHAETTAIVIGDFSENYICVNQNEVQSAHFTKTQVTIHPFVAYVKHLGTNYVVSCAVISDCLQHDTKTVFAFQKHFIEYLGSKFPHINHIEYWSDGCAAQYKNYKNFANILHHKNDFGLSANWNFFTTSHGKTGGDGVGASVKYSTRRESLLRTQSDFIDSAEKVFKYCESKGAAWKIKPLFVSSSNVAEISKQFKLNERFKIAKCLPQTQKCHRIVISGNTIKALHSSISTEPFLEIATSTDDRSHRNVVQNEAKDIELVDEQQLNVLVDYNSMKPGQWAAVTRSGTWFIALMRENPNKEAGTILVELMENPGSSETFRVPDVSNANTVCINTSDVLQLVFPKEVGTTTRSLKQLRIDVDEVKQVETFLLRKLRQS